ncbi:hypothetical protein Tco_0881430 [Tanacetum coccineum]
MFDQGLHKEITDMKEVFTQMETDVAKCFIERKTFEIKEKELIIENALLLEHIICQDVMSVVMHADVELKNVLSANNNSLEHDNLEAELLKKENDRLLELIISQDLVHMVVNSLAKLLDYKRMYKIDLEPLSPKLLRNMEAHVDYLKHTQENANRLREIVKQARELWPLDSDLDSACKFATQIQELLVYISATCPSLSKHRVISSTSASGSKPPGNTKKNRIS